MRYSLFTLLLSATLYGNHLFNAPNQTRETVAPLKCKAAIDELESKGFVIPYCPQEGGLPTAGFPTSAIFIKIYQDGSFLDVRDFVDAVVQTGSPTVINLLIDRTGTYLKQKLIDDLKESYPKVKITDKGKIVQGGNGSNGTINLVSDPSTSSTFIHDFGKQVLDKEGSWKFFLTRHRDSGDFGKFLKEKCGISLIPSPEIKGRSSSQVQGGNYLAISEDHVLTGGRIREGKLTLGEDHAAHLGTLAKHGVGHTLLDTGFLRVGHVDEIVAPVKVNRAPPCSLGIVMADTKLGWQQAFNKQQEKENSENKKSSNLIRSIILPKAHAEFVRRGPRKYSPISCEYLDLVTLEAVNKYKSGLIAEDAMIKSMISGKPKFAKQIQMIGTKGQYKEDIETFPKYQELIYSKDEKSPRQWKKFFNILVGKYCVGWSGLSKRMAIDFPNYREEDKKKAEALKKFSLETVPKIQKENEKRIKEALVAHTGCSNPTIIKVPILFSNAGGSAVTLLPNSVNLVSLGARKVASDVIVPKSTSSSFDSSIEKTLKKHGINAAFSDSVWCQRQYGNHSCSTSIFRACKPRKN